MPNWLSSLPIETVRTLAAVYAVVSVLVIVLLLPFGVRARSRGRWYAVLGAAAVLGAGIGWALVWWLGDVQDVFGVQLSTVVHVAGAALFAGVAVALVGLFRTSWWRKAVAVVAVPAVLAAGGLMINEDFAYYPTLGDVVGDTGVGALVAGGLHASSRPLADWRAPADMPTTGELGTVTIPGTLSHFHARKAWVWLPPAALVKHPPRLPVVIGLSGQPGQPSDLFLAGHLDETMDAIAKAHHGVAPVLVVPDQLGSATRNPMCVNSRLGRVATYITVDVRHWILSHESVSSDRRAWTIAGFSEGGTCSIQFGSGYPAEFGSIVDVSGELAPRNGTVTQTIDRGFGRSARAYLDASPLHVLAHHRYPSTHAMFAVGGDDDRYRPITLRMAKAAARAGMTVRTYVVPGTAHDWHTASQGLAWGIEGLVPRWGLPS
ncbi:alpha/beta hydrolase-fold protein [Amnibacterium soli]|uniref:Alpha/beta hydrolase-fold protein n=1 Tax=Amnibacterium soli TaxID=1282736 RepID=A0ABP8Z3I6_9MICO